MRWVEKMPKFCDVQAKNLSFGLTTSTRYTGDMFFPSYCPHIVYKFNECSLLILKLLKFERFKIGAAELLLHAWKLFLWKELIISCRYAKSMKRMLWMLPRKLSFLQSKWDNLHILNAVFMLSLHGVCQSIHNHHQKELLVMLTLM